MKKTTGIITDGQIRRKSEKKGSLQQLRVKDVMTKNPISINPDILAAKALALMNSKRITFSNNLDQAVTYYNKYESDLNISFQKYFKDAVNEFL